MERSEWESGEGLKGVRTLQVDGGTPLNLGLAVSRIDGKHSWEDAILPVEEAYETYGDRIAILGGLDMDFLCREPREVITERCRRLLEMSRVKGGYALGTGNSIAPYIPLESFRAIVDTVLAG